MKIEVTAKTAFKAAYRVARSERFIVTAVAAAPKMPFGSQAFKSVQDRTNALLAQVNDPHGSHGVHGRLGVHGKLHNYYSKRNPISPSAEAIALDNRMATETQFIL